MITEEILEYAKQKKWFNAGITHIHNNELRTAYFRVQTLEDAIKRFTEVSNEKIIQAFLFDTEDVMSWIERR